MGLKSTRVILTSLLCFVMATSTLCAIISAVTSITLADSAYVTKKMVSPQVIEECTDQLNMKFEALEAKSGIPARVFQTSMLNSGVEFALISATDNIFSVESPTLYSDERVEYFYNFCTEYLDGNNIKYKKQDILNVSNEAAHIFSDTIGMHGVESMPARLVNIRKNSMKSLSASLLAVVMGSILISLIHRKKNSVIYSIFCATAGGGAGAVIGGLLCIITKLSSSVVIYPEAYKNSFCNMLNSYFAYIALLGLLCTIVSYIAINYIIKLVNRENNRQLTRFSKVIGK